MAINTFLQGLGATHLFTLNNVGTSTSDDLGDSSTPTNITSGTYSFQASPTCTGVTHSVRTEASTSTNIDGATFVSKTDINSGNIPYSTGSRSILFWFRQEEIQNPSCIYEQGGGINNFAIMGGAQLTFQAADSGQPFLICAAKNIAIANRNYLAVCGWEYHTQHAGSGNRIYLILNGVYQSGSESTGTEPFPGHSGDITLGNSGEALRSFAGTTFVSQTTAKNSNYLSFYNNVSLTEAQSRQVFERMVIPEVLIASDTVSNQQAALDALSGNTYQDVNCAIEIRQATDATNYSLTFNNITFVENANLKDIAVQYVGPNTLTVINAGSNIVETSTPIEKDLDGGTNIITGGGTINIVNTYSLAVTGLSAGSRLRIYNETTSAQVYNAVVSGTSYTASYIEGTGYSANDVLSLRIAKIDKIEAIASVVVGNAGWTALISQEPNLVYSEYGVNGATVTGVSWDSGNMQFDFNEADNVVNGPDIGAWYQYFITTEIGIAETFGSLIWPQINRLTNATSKTPVTFDNTNSNPLQINNLWIDRDDGTSIIAALSNSIQINPPAVFVQETGISGLTPAENTQLFGLPDTSSIVQAQKDAIY